MSFGKVYVVIPAVIAAGGSLSAAADLGGLRLAGIEMPAGWTAAGLTFQGAATNPAGLADLYDGSGAEVTLPAAAGRFIQVDEERFAGIRWLKIRSGTSATPVTQAAERTLRLVLVEE